MFFVKISRCLNYAKLNLGRAEKKSAPFLMNFQNKCVKANFYQKKPLKHLDF